MSDYRVIGRRPRRDSQTATQSPEEFFRHHSPQLTLRFYYAPRSHRHSCESSMIDTNTPGEHLLCKPPKRLQIIYPFIPFSLFPMTWGICFSLKG